MKRVMSGIYGLLLFLALSSNGALGQELRFNVEHRRLFRNSTGVLRFDEAGITYDASRREKPRRWSFQDIRHAEILSPDEIVLHTYGEPDRYEFRLREGQLSERAYRLLAERVPRGVTSRLLFPASEFLYEIPAKHQHRFGGCEGVLRINSDLMIFESEDSEDRRMWRTRDLRDFGTTGPYSLRLATELETFNFDLKAPMTRDLYDFLWQTFYGRH